MSREKKPLLGVSLMRYSFFKKKKIEEVIAGEEEKGYIIRLRVD